MSATLPAPPAIADTAAWRLFQEGGLTTEFVAIEADEAAALAREWYGVTPVGALTRFATEKDDTFRLDAADGPHGAQRYVFKIANPDENVAEIDLQLQALQHIARADPALPVPRVYPDRSGDILPEITDRAGQRRRLRLLSFVDGTPFDRVATTTAAQRAQIGEVLARLRLALADFRHESQARVLAWDVQHLLTLEPLLTGIDDASERALLAAALARYAEVAAPRIPHLRAQVLHNDFNQSNVVVDPDGARFVSGVIDFGDIVRTAIAIDVSTAMIGQLPRHDGIAVDDDLFATSRDLLRGYLGVADLTAEERALVPHLTMGRVIARTLLTVWRARMFPHNATYILRNTGPGWAQLRWFLQRSPEQVSDALTL